MKVSRQTLAMGTKTPPEHRAPGPRLPHKTDPAADSDPEHAPRRVGKQAHLDVERGLEDTDRRGGEEYQRRTQRDAQVNSNSRKKPPRG